MLLNVDKAIYYRGCPGGFKQAGLFVFVVWCADIAEYVNIGGSCRFYSGGAVFDDDGFFRGLIHIRAGVEEKIGCGFWSLYLDFAEDMLFFKMWQ